MLSIHWIQDVDYYLDQATADYYFRPGEPPGRWWGQGAKSLGLNGVVKAEQLKALCKGYSPEGNSLIQNAGAADHQQAWDLTFSAPKSVSVLWSQAPRAIRLKIRKLHQKAIKEALKYLTEVAILTRRGKGGLIRENAQPIVAIFEHGSNRELEPQLHSHCVLVNVAARDDGTFGTILSKPFYNHKLTAGAIYQTQFAHLLKNELGLRIEKQETAFGLVGMPQKLLEHYSTRSKQIRAQMGSHVQHSSKAAARAALETRKSKRIPPPRAELFKRWQETNRNFGFTERDAHKLIGRVKAKTALPNLSDCLESSIQELLETESYFSEQRLICTVAIAKMGEGIPANHIIEQVRSHINTHPGIVPIGEFHEEPQFTTREMLELEKRLFAAIADAINETSHIIGESVVERLLDPQLPLNAQLTSDELTRNKEQRAAVMRLTTTPGAIKVLEGMAGTGKTHTLSVARQAWERAGYDVTGMALSGVAARNLQDGSGIESDTIAMRLLQLDSRGNFARHHKRQLKRLLKGQRTYRYAGSNFRLNAKSIVIVDEAGMVGTRQMFELIKHARKAGAKLVLIGDRRQLQPIEAGGPFRPIADATGKACLDHVVRQNIEPDDPNPTWHRKTGILLAYGGAADAIKLFAERGRFHVYDDFDSTMLAMVRNWSVEGIADPTNHILLAGTKAAVAQLNAMCQSARLEAGFLGKDCIAIADNPFRIGDTVLFLKRSRLCQVENGDRGVVLSFNQRSKTMAVRLYANGKTVFIPYRDYQDIQLGYAMTTHKAQGATVPSVHVLLGGPMQDRHLSYVQSTRARESTRLYVSKQNAGPQLKDIIQQMSRNRPKRLAHEVMEINELHYPSSLLKHDDSRSAGRQQPPQPEVARSRDAIEKARQPVSRKRAKKKSAQRKTSRLSSSQQVPKGTARPMHPNLKKVRRQINRASKKPAAKKASKEIVDKPNAISESTEIVEIERLLAQLKSRSRSLRKEAAPTAESLVANSNAVSSVVASTQPLTPSHPQERTPATKPDSDCVFSLPKIEFPPRHIFDLSHVTIEGRTDCSVLNAAIERYGRLPGGIVVEGEACCDFPVYSIAIDATSPSKLIINENLQFDTGLTVEEVALLWHAVMATDGEQNFGALSQCEALGIENDTVVAVTMMRADNAFGGFVYGYDSTFSIRESRHSYGRNPYLNELYSATWLGDLPRQCFNFLYELRPQCFLRIIAATFTNDRLGRVTITNTNIQAALGVLDGKGKPATLPSFSHLNPAVDQLFPEVHRAFRHFVDEFVTYARSEPSLVRAIAYAQVILLLRHAKSLHALPLVHDTQLPGTLRKSPSIPRFNYTLRSDEFMRRTSDVAQYLSRRTDSPTFDCLITALVGLRFATLAGDFDSFQICKKAASNCITALYRQPPAASAPAHHQELYRLFGRALHRISNCPHDILINNWLQEAFHPNRTREQRRESLEQALGYCGTATMIDKNPATRCIWLEIKSYLDATFDPVPGLLQARSEDISLQTTFQALKQISATRRYESPDHGIRYRVIEAIDRIEAYGPHAPSRVIDDDYNVLEEYVEHERLLQIGTPKRPASHGATTNSLYVLPDDVSISRRVFQLLVARLRSLPPTTFLLRVLHPDNPFVASHALLDHETRHRLDVLFNSIRTDVEVFDTVASERWWQQFLRQLAAPLNSDISKIGLILAYELCARGINVGQLHQQMRRFNTESPQATLLMLDLDTDKVSQAASDFLIRGDARTTL